MRKNVEMQLLIDDVINPLIEIVYMCKRSEHYTVIPDNKENGWYNGLIN